VKGNRHPPAKGQPIDALFAWIVSEPEGERVCSAQIGNTEFPLVGADLDQMKSLRAPAELIRRAFGYPVRLVRFSRREDFEVLP
jgi:hypothetical protein